jgi:hypothetical protein
MKFGLDIDEARLKEIIVDMKGKRMVSRFGNCYGLKEMEELTPKEEEQYETLGTIKEVVDKCFKETGVDSELVGFALGAVKIGLIELWSANYEPKPFQSRKNDSS